MSADSERRERVATSHGVPDDPVDALDRYERVYSTSNVGGREAVHVHPCCPHLDGDNSVRTLSHPGEISLRCEDVCDPCQELYTDEEGRLKPARADGSIYKRELVPAPLRRTCGCAGCTDEAFSVVEHPEHGARTVCPRHRRRFPVVEVVADV